MFYYFKKYIPIYKAKNKICFGFVGESNKYLEINFEQNIVKTINRLLKYGISKKELENSSFFKKLLNLNFLYKTNYQEKQDFINRNYLFIEYLTDKKLNLKKLDKRIMIFGAGAGGSTLAFQLSQFGFKDIYIVDNDIVEISDIYRNFIYCRNHLKRKKVEVLKEEIKLRFKVDLNIRTDLPLNEEEINSHVLSYEPDIIIKACDPNGIFLHNLNKVCFNKNIPFLSIAYSYEKIKLGPFLIPGITACANSLTNFNVLNFGDHYDIKYFERIFEDKLVHPSINYNINLLSALAFKEILFFSYEMFDYCQTIGRLIIFNPLTFSLRGVNFKCKKNCTICCNVTKK